MSDAAQLQRLTVVQLKARCQELGIQGISKLNKARLVERILDATTAITQAPSPITASASAAPKNPKSPKNSSSTQEPSPNAHSLGPSRTKNALRGSQSRNKTPAPGPPNPTNDDSTDVSRSALAPNAPVKKATAPQNPTSSSVTTGANASRSSKKRTRTTSSSKSKSAATATATKSTSVSKPPKKACGVGKTVTNKLPPSLPSGPDFPGFQAASNIVHPLAPSTTTSSSTEQPRNVLTQPDRNTAASSQTTTIKSSRSVLATRVTARSGIPQKLSRPSSAGRSPLGGLSTAKSGRGATFVAPSHKFTPLKRLPTPARIQTSQSIQTSQQISTFPLVSLICTDEFPEGTVDNRITHVKSHFVNRLFVRLNGTRNPPILAPPFPTPFSFPPEWNGRLAFPGFHPNVFSASNIALAVAIRFWIARAHTMFQLGAAQEWSVNANGMGILGPDMAQWPPVMSCERLVEELYLVTTREHAGRSSINSDNARSPQVDVQVRYIVLAQTGDVIASSRRNLSDPSQPPSGQYVKECGVRPDWYSYVQSALELESQKGDERTRLATNLLSRVKTKDQADFPSGINKAWAEKQGESPEALAVAKRVVLTSCILNSFSGEHLDAMQMEASWLNQSAIATRRPKQSIELYLPESHQILSVHLLPPPFHPSLAVVHRHAGRSEYVLKDTGHVVGDEDGVCDLWQGILGCDYKGNEMDTLDFWKGWEKRLRHGG